MAPVVRALKNRPGAEVIVCVTGQHREMLSPILKFFEIVPDIDLGLMRPDQTLASLTARLIESLDEVIRRTAPQWVIAQGDTTSVMAGAISAFYRKVPFAHVEAGLRTGDFNAPFPEEFHRRVADLTASLHFAPTAAARNQLIAEGVSPDQVILSGNTVVDALLQMSPTGPPGHWPPLIVDYRLFWLRPTAAKALANRSGKSVLRSNTCQINSVIVKFSGFFPST
jgi:UDP-N-acetylglucosamine 2-epimerase (non-hydrolysing)